MGLSAQQEIKVNEKKTDLKEKKWREEGRKEKENYKIRSNFIVD